jgi:hypothetical protein
MIYHKKVAESAQVQDVRREKIQEGVIDLAKQLVFNTKVI